jgi:hypothetical protein
VRLNYEPAQVRNVLYYIYLVDDTLHRRFSLVSYRCIRRSGRLLGFAGGSNGFLDRCKISGPNSPVCVVQERFEIASHRNVCVGKTVIE